MIVEDVYGKRRVESPDNITNLNLQEIEEIEPVSSRFNRKQISAIVELMRRFAAEKGHMLEITKIEMLDENKVLRKSVEVDPKDTNRIAELLSDYWTKKNLLPYGHIIAVIKAGKERIELTRQSLVILPASAVT